MEKVKRKSIFEKALFKSKIRSANVKFPEMLLGYFIGPFGALLASGIFTSFLNYYWTDVLFLSEKVLNPITGEYELPSFVTNFLTVLPFVSTFVIIAGNFIVGQIIERTKTSAGKARPWILLSSILLSVSCVIMFISPSDNVTVKMVMTAISYNLYYSVAYPLYNTANSTLIPVSTRNSSERGLLASFTNIAGLAVMGAGSMVFPIVIELFLKQSVGAWAIAFIAVAVFTFITTVLQYYFTRERVSEELFGTTQKQKEKISVKKQVSAVFTDKFWIIIIVFYLIFQFSGAIKNLSMAYFCKQVVDNSFWGVEDGSGMTQTLLAVLGAIPMAVAMLFVWPLSNKFGKQKITFVGLIIGVIGGVIEIIGGSSVIPVAIGVALKCLGSAPACYMILAMIADVLDHIEAKRGYRCDGFTMSVYSTIMVAATGFCTAIFNAISGGGANSTAVSISYVWVETVAYGICAILILFFTVEKFMSEDKKTIIERQKEIALKNGEEWIDPEQKLKMEQEKAENERYENALNELKAKCDKKGLDFEKEKEKLDVKMKRKPKQE